MPSCLKQSVQTVPAIRKFADNQSFVGGGGGGGARATGFSVDLPTATDHTNPKLHFSTHL